MMQEHMCNCGIVFEFDEILTQEAICPSCHNRHVLIVDYDPPDYAPIVRLLEEPEE